MDAQDLQENSSTQRQHFVPRTYLRKFAGKDGYLRIMTREQGTCFSPKPANVMVERGIYDLSRVIDGFSGDIPANFVEKMFGLTETVYSDKMASSIDLGMYPDFMTMKSIALFVLHLSARTPCLRTSFEDWLTANPDDELSTTGKRMISNFGVISFTVAIQSVTLHFKTCEYELIKAPQKGCFLSSDNPASHWLVFEGQWSPYYEQTSIPTQQAIIQKAIVDNCASEEEYKLLTSDRDRYRDFIWNSLLPFRRIICPLSPDYLLLLKPVVNGKETYTRRQSGIKELKLWNTRITAAADKFLILPPKSAAA